MALPRTAPYTAPQDISVRKSEKVRVQVREGITEESNE